jgi:hypothetical protein
MKVFLLFSLAGLPTTRRLSFTFLTTPETLNRALFLLSCTVPFNRLVSCKDVYLWIKKPENRKKYAREAEQSEFPTVKLGTNELMNIT